MLSINAVINAYNRSMHIQENIQLRSLNTMATPAIAKWFAVAQTEEDILFAVDFCKEKQCQLLVLGEGSNTVFINNLNVLVLANRIGGAGQIRNLFSSDAIEFVSETTSSVDFLIGAGVKWHQVVEQSLQNGYSGLEQMALIPGLVGAAPIQNIGAYGSELKDVLQNVHAIDTRTGEMLEFSNRQCEFAYRDSLFKQKPGQYIITKVQLRFSKHEVIYKLDQLYPALRKAVKKKIAEKSITDQTVNSQAIFDAVCAVRESKLPNPKEMPNAGSFFKNPIISQEMMSGLLKAFPAVVHYPVDEGFKLAAGWLIEQAGLKGVFCENGVACYDKQALVIVNPKMSSGQQVIKFAALVQQKIVEKFGVELEIEPRLYEFKEKELHCVST